MENIQIKPITKTLNTLQILSISVQLDKSARISYSIMGDELSDGGVLTMDGETYAEWGTNDEYVVNWVLTELGLERA